MWEMLGFECDSYSSIDTIPLSNPNYGVNARSHADSEVNTTRQADPNGNYTATRIGKPDSGGG